MKPDDIEFYAERLRDAYHLLRHVSAREGKVALEREGVYFNEETGTGTRDGLADDMLEARSVLLQLAENQR